MMLLRCSHTFAFPYQCLTSDKIWDFQLIELSDNYHDKVRYEQGDLEKNLPRIDLEEKFLRNSKIL